MAIKMKRSAVAAKAPGVADLALGELAVNTNDGKLYLKKNDGTEAIIEIGPVRSVSGKTGIVTLQQADVSGLVTALGAKMPKAGGAFTGDVTILALLETEDASSATSYALDPTTNGTRTTLTLTAATSLTDSMTDGESITLRVLNGDTHTLTFVAGTLWVGGSAPTLTDDDLIRFEKWGTDLIGYVGLGVA